MICFSVIITTYRSAATITRLLRSIFDQQGAGKQFTLDVILVDDCSPDNTVELAQSFDVRIFKTPKNSGGPNAGRNIGLANAIGDFLTIADHDDEWMPDRLLKHLPHLEKAPILTSGYRVVQPDGTSIDRVQKNHPIGNVLYFQQNNTFISRLTKSKNGQTSYLGGIVFHKKFQTLRFEEHFGAVDYDWVVQLFHRQESLEINEALYIRYETGGNLSLNANYRRSDFYYSLLTLEDFESEYPAETQLARSKIYGSRARYHYVMGEMKKARYYFRMSGFSVLTLLYWLTTFGGHRWVVKKFKVFG